MEIVVMIAIVLAFLRILGARSPAFQAVAHLFVGGLFVAWRYEGDVDRRRAFLVLWVVLSVVELVCFVVGRFAVTAN